MAANPRKRKSRGAAPASPAKVALVKTEQATPKKLSAQSMSTNDLIEETRKVLASLDPQASGYPRHRPEDHRIYQSGSSEEVQDELISSTLSLAAFKADLLGPKEKRRASQGGTAEKEAVEAPCVDWQMYRDWPEGIAEDEKAMRVRISRSVATQLGSY